MITEKISVIINTLNEEDNIANCLESVKWADEIIIVDMYSDDKTIEIAKKYTDKIFFHERLGYADPARNFALQKATHNWVLSIDADELVPLKMKQRLIKIFKNDEADAVYLPHNNYFFGKLMIDTGWGAVRDSHLRFFKKDFIEYTDKVHDLINVRNNPRILKIKNPEAGFIHFNYDDVEDFLHKLNKYTTIEAKNISKGLKPDFGLFKLVYITAREFFYRYFRFKGYKDGVQGLYLSFMMSFYYVAVFSKLHLIKKYKSMEPKEKVLGIYDEITKKVLDEYRNE